MLTPDGHTVPVKSKSSLRPASTTQEPLVTAAEASLIRLTY